MCIRDRLTRMYAAYSIKVLDQGLEKSGSQDRFIILISEVKPSPLDDDTEEFFTILTN